jgi:HK97 family phage portal protein
LRCARLARAYDYKVDESTLTRIPVLDEDGWPNLIHIKAMHPADDYYGAARWLRQAGGADPQCRRRWNRALLENAARPSGALVYDPGDGTAGLTADQFDRLKQRTETAFSGHGNAGRPMLLEGGLKWQSLALSPADMDFADAESAAARDIALAFGVPPMLLGLPGDNTYANYREANRALWRLTLLPLAGKICPPCPKGCRPGLPDAPGVDLDRSRPGGRPRAAVVAGERRRFPDPTEKRALLGLEPEPSEKGTP